MRANSAAKKATSKPRSFLCVCGNQVLVAVGLVGDCAVDDRGRERRKVRVGREPILHRRPSQAVQQAKRPFEGRRSGGGVEAREKRPRARLPGPPQVHCNAQEVFEPHDLSSRPFRS